MQPKLALVYHEDAYVESGGNAIGLMGRQVAGRAFPGCLSELWHLHRANGRFAPARAGSVARGSLAASTPRPRPVAGLCGLSTAQTFTGRSFRRPPLHPARAPATGPRVRLRRASNAVSTPSPCQELLTHFVHPKPSTCSGHWSRLRSRFTTPSFAPHVPWQRWFARSQRPMRITYAGGLAECP